MDWCAPDHFSLRISGVALVIGKPVLTSAARVALDTAREGATHTDWPGVEAELRAAGPAVWQELAEILVAGPADSGERAAVLLGFDTVTDEIRGRVAELLDENPVTRVLALDRRSREGSAAAPYARVMATLLDDPSTAVAATAVRTFGQIGPAAVPVLREVRATPGRARRAALGALAEIGWDTLDPHDLRVAARLIAWKQATEIPEPLHLDDGEWYAIPTDDQAAVSQAFDLSDPVPVTLRAGLERWSIRDDYLSQISNRDADGDHRSCAQMFVSPVLDGWTLVVGRPPAGLHRDGENFVAQQQRCRELSKRFGSAYWFSDLGAYDGMIWCLAEHGELVRYYRTNDPVEIGDPLPAEAEFNPPETNLITLVQNHLPEDVVRTQMAKRVELTFRQLELPEFEYVSDGWYSLDKYHAEHHEFVTAVDEWAEAVIELLAEAGVEYRPEATAYNIAERATVTLGPHTNVRGGGVLALTDCGRRQGHGHRGAYAL